MAVKRTTRAQMIDTMAGLLRKQGFHATAINQLIRESGTPKGSLYFHFPGGKEELACAALDHAGQRWRLDLEEAIREASSTAQVIEAACQAWLDRLVASDFSEGSPLATVALEASSTSLRVRETCAQHYAAWQALLCRRLESVGLSTSRAQALATTLLSAIEGALVLCRIHRSTAPLEEVAATLAHALAGEEESSS